MGTHFHLGIFPLAEQDLLRANVVRDGSPRSDVVTAIGLLKEVETFPELIEEAIRPGGQ